MNITIARNRTPGANGPRLALRVSAAVGLFATGLTVTGAIGGREASPANPQPRAGAIERAVPDLQHVYYYVESQQAAIDALVAESVTAQEQLLAGIVAPERVVYIIDDSAAGRMTAAEAMLVAR
jgi:hypothetical protein